MRTVPSKSGPLPPPERKVVYVREMFARIAERYDLMNRLMTLGRDRAWRRYTVAQALACAKTDAAAGRAVRVLDVATGTGDLALEVLRQEPLADVTGIDLVPEMLAVARRKFETPTVRQAPGRTNRSPERLPAEPKAAGGPRRQRACLVAGDALRLPFPDAWFDAVVTGFALRNVMDIPAALAEMARVTRTGGRLACLELAKPRLPVFRQLYALYFFRAVPLLGRWLAGGDQAYTYLPHSLSVFLAPEQVAELLRGTGWVDVRVRRLMLGTVAVHIAVRE